MGIDLRIVPPLVWWVLGGVLLLIVIARLKGYTLRDLMQRSKIAPPGPAPIPHPHSHHARQTDPEKAAFALLQAQAKHQLERKADELERRKRDAAREITADFLAESAAEMQRPFDPPGETGAAPGSGK